MSPGQLVELIFKVFLGEAPLCLGCFDLLLSKLQWIGQWIPHCLEERTLELSRVAGFPGLAFEIELQIPPERRKVHEHILDILADQPGLSL